MNQLFIAKVILACHAVIVVATVALGFWAAAYPSWWFFVGAAIWGLALALSNRRKGCFLTVWERRRLGVRAYKDPCIVHYVRHWFGITISPKLVPGIYTGCCVIALARLLFGA